MSAPSTRSVEIQTLIGKTERVSFFLVELIGIGTFYRIKLQTFHDGVYAYYMSMEFTDESLANSEFKKLTER